jgi:hypothetical protein
LSAHTAQGRRQSLALAAACAVAVLLLANAALVIRLSLAVATFLGSLAWHSSRAGSGQAAAA